MALTVLDRRGALCKALNAERAAGRRVGLVPTMGSLHEGHTSLMARAAAECDVVVATLFVNPLQFGPGEDLATYPRDPDGDRRKAEAAGVGYLFAPSQEEMFPDPPVTVVSVGRLGDVFEGAIRPGHFGGVATIVTKLLSLAGACRAYFGEKDYQQLAIIRRITADLSLPAEIVACPTVRAADGLALSSRNAYLTPEQRAVAPILHQALAAGAAVARSGHPAFGPARPPDASRAAGDGACAGPARQGDAVAGPARQGDAVAGPARQGDAVAGPARQGDAVAGPARQGAPTAGPARQGDAACTAAGEAAIRDGYPDAGEVRAVMMATVAAQPAFHLEYAEVVDPVDLTPLTTIDRECRLLIAARLGRTRLIDNLAVEYFGLDRFGQERSRERFTERGSR